MHPPLQTTHSNALKQFRTISSIAPHEQTEEDLAATLTHDFDQQLRLLYGQFFTAEYKQSQDKIRNKNAVFKAVHSLAQNELARIREGVRGALAREQEEGTEREEMRKELELAHQKIAQMIGKIS
jgi:uncharacterized protein involved in exopolysaccharide biosynthesis